MKIPVTVALQVAELTNKVEMYKKYSPLAVTEKVEGRNKPTRVGLGKTLKNTK
jgi:hypothetical protein